jgi:hypothetical protein
MHVAGEEAGVREEVSANASVFSADPDTTVGPWAEHLSAVTSLSSVEEVSSSVSVLSSIGSAAKRLGEG